MLDDADILFLIEVRKKVVEFDSDLLDSGQRGIVDCLEEPRLGSLDVDFEQIHSINPLRYNE